MKIRHKQKGTIIEVSVALSQGWLGPMSQEGEAVFFSEAYYEAVEEEVWQDVTKDVEIIDPVFPFSLQCHGARIASLEPWAESHYRFRKIRVADCSEHGMGRYQYQTVFILEYLRK